MSQVAEPTRLKWLQERQKGIGGSDAAAAVGLSPWKTPYELWLDKTQAITEERDEPYLRWGHILEPVIRQEYSNVTGFGVLNPNEAMVHPKHTFALANVDGIVVETLGDEPRRLFEGKTASAFMPSEEFGAPGTDEVPIQYLMQCQHYMGVTGYSMTDLAVLIGGSDFRIYTIEADAELQEELFRQEAEFWGYVVRNEPPPPTSHDDVKKRWSKCLTDDMVEAEPQHLAKWERLGEIREQQKELEAERDDIEKDLKQHIKDAAGIAYCGTPLATWKSNKDSLVFNRSKFELENPEMFNEYMEIKPGNRTFLFKKPKKRKAE